MRDYQAAYREFSIEKLEREVLQGDFAGGLNACIECCDRWVADDRVALVWFGRDDTRESVTFRELQNASARFANLLRSYGIGRGDTVAGLLPRIPELLVAVLGTWRAGAIYQPLFTAFGPAAIEHRVTAEGGSQAKLIVTDAANRPKLDEVPHCPPVLLADHGHAGRFATLLAAQQEDFAPVMLHGDDPFVTIFTSGTTGRPKAVRYSSRHVTERSKKKKKKKRIAIPRPRTRCCTCPQGHHVQGVSSYAVRTSTFAARFRTDRCTPRIMRAPIDPRNQYGHFN